MKVHELKSDTIQFDDIDKNECRIMMVSNEIIYKTGDVISLREYNPLIQDYTERIQLLRVQHIYLGPNLLKNFVALSIRVIK